ncbi:phage tail length tape measure family protein [Undibacterium sp. TJN25]|uniref:phage tail length tape measure family protein n=1 Tax=Undibacterium sp. TJN25 TaxID=3413056 RepID=UPI003BF04146
MGSTVEYGIRINIDGNKAAVDSISDVTKATTDMGNAAQDAGQQLADSAAKTAAATKTSAAATEQATQTITAGLDKSTQATTAMGAASEQVSQKIIGNYKTLSSSTAQASVGFTQMNSSAAQLGSTNAQLSNSTAQLTLGQLKFLDALRDQAAGVGLSRTELLKLQAAQMGLKDVSAGFIKQIEDATEGQHKFSLANAQSTRELMVLSHELATGNFSRFGGSMMVLANATGATSMLFTATAAAVAAALLPLGLFIAAAIAGAGDISKMNDALIVTGNYAGVSTGQLAAASQKIGDVNNNIGKTREILTGLAASGKFGGDALLATGAAASAFAKLTGESAEDVGKQFEKMDDGVAKFAQNFDKQYHMIDTATLERIDSLEKQGQKEEAVSTLSNAIAQETQSRIAALKSSLNDGQRAWDAIGEAAKGAWEKMKSAAQVAIGNEPMMQELQARMNLKQGNRTADNFFVSLRDSVTGTNNDDRIHELVTNLDAQAKQSADDKALADIKTKGNAAYTDITGALAQYDKNNAKARELAKVKRDFIDLLKANPDSPILDGVSIVDDQVSGGKYDAIIDGIAKKYQEKGNDARATELANAMRDNQAAIAEEKRKYDEMGKLADLYHKYGQTTDEEYYQQKRDQALGIEQAQIDGYNSDLTALKSYNAKTAEERVKNAGQIADITAKKLAAESAYQDHLKFFDAEESLRAQKVAQDSTDAMNKYVSSLQQEAEKVEDSAKVRNVANSVLQGEEAARIDAALAAAQQNLAQQQLNGATEQELASSQAIIDYLTKISDLRHRIVNAEQTKESNAAALAEAKKYEQAWQASNKAIGDGLYDAIGRGGDSAIKKLIQDVKSWFARLVLSPIIQPIAAFGASLINPQAASAQSSLDGLSSAADMISQGKSLWDGFSAAGSASSLGTGFLGSIAGGLNGAGIGSGLTSSLGLSIGNSIAGVVGPGIAGAMSTAMAAVPYIGAAYAAYSILKSGFSMGDKQMVGQNVTGDLGTNDITRNVAWHQDGGWLRGDRNGVWNYNLANSTAIADGKAYQDIASVASDTALLKSLNDGYDALKQANADYAKTLGLNADFIANRKDAINFDIGATAADTQANVQKAFADISDSMATDILGSLSSLSQAGETSSATLARLVSDFTAVNAVLTATGKTADAFGALGAASVAAREDLIQLTGGLQNLQNGTSFFVQNFLSEGEQIAPTLKAVKDAMAALGEGGVTTKEQFKDLVQQQDLSTEAGRQMYANLIALAPAFLQAANYADTLTQATIDQAKAAADAAQQALDQANQKLDTARSALSDAYNAESSAIQGVIDKWSQFSISIKQFKDSLLVGNLSTLSPEQKYAETKSQFDQTYALALAGDPTAMGNLQQMAQNFLDASQSYNASNQGYVDDFNKVQGALSNAATAADQQVSIAQTQLTALNDSVKGILDVKDAVMSVHDALVAYFNAQNDVVSAGGGGGYVDPSTGNPVGSKALADVAAYGAQYGDNAYYFIPVGDKAGGANHLQDLEDNVDAMRALYQQSGQSDAAGKSFADYTDADIWQQLTGHSEAYWDQITAMFDAGQHPTTDTKVDGSHANGLDRVPRDGYIAELHEGEQVLTAAQAIKFNRLPLINTGAAQSDDSRTVAELRRLNDRIGQLEQSLVSVGIAQLTQSAQHHDINTTDMKNQTKAVKGVRTALETAL